MTDEIHRDQIDKGMTRRAFAGGLLLTAVAGLSACSPATGKQDKGANGTMVPGTYAATKSGFMGENTVYVTVDETSIKSVEVGKSTDLPTYLTQFPLKTIPQRIVDAQSVTVDAVSGATLTSMSIMSAVKDCIQQAGGEDMFDAAPAKPDKTKGETVETDVIVIGGGMAGCMAALSAKQVDFNLQDSGLSVTLIEKQDFIGGSLPLAFGGFFTGSPLSTPPKQSYIDSQVERMQMMNEGKVNVPLLTHLMNVAGDDVIKMQELGVPLLTSGMDGEGLDAVGKRFNGDVYTCYPMGLDWRHAWGIGRHTIDVFNIWFPTLGVDLRTSTSATELIIERGVVVGARVEGPESTYDIRAKKVILSCGGFARNKEMIEQYAPHDSKSLVWSNGGADGDGIRMGVDAGGRTVGSRLWGYPATGNTYGLHNGPDQTANATGFMVNKNGEKFCDYGSANSIAYALVAEQPDHEAYCIVDGETVFVEDLEAGLTSGAYDGIVFRGETLEELAQKCGIDAVNLAATVKAHNEHLATRGDVGYVDFDLLENTEFIGATPIANGPFYGVRFVQIHLGSCVGLVVDENCKVLGASNTPIENLYATGECCIGGNIFDFHVGGWGIGGACHSGRIAGEDAKKALLG